VDGGRGHNTDPIAPDTVIPEKRGCTLSFLLLTSINTVFSSVSNVSHIALTWFLQYMLFLSFEYAITFMGTLNLGSPVQGPCFIAELEMNTTMFCINLIVSNVVTSLRDQHCTLYNSAYTSAMISSFSG
jgi:hypothetical protein